MTDFKYDDYRMTLSVTETVTDDCDDYDCDNCDDCDWRLGVGVRVGVGVWVGVGIGVGATKSISNLFLGCWLQPADQQVSRGALSLPAPQRPQPPAGAGAAAAHWDQSLQEGGLLPPLPHHTQ